MRLRLKGRCIHPRVEIVGNKPGYASRYVVVVLIGLATIGGDPHLGTIGKKVKSYSILSGKTVAKGFVQTSFLLFALAEKMPIIPSPLYSLRIVDVVCFTQVFPVSELR